MSTFIIALIEYKKMISYLDKRSFLLTIVRDV